MWRENGLSTSPEIANHRFLAFGATPRCSQLAVKGGALPAVEDEKKVDHRRHSQDEQHFSDRAMFVDRSGLRNGRDAPNTDRKTESCQSMSIPWKPKTGSHEKEKTPKRHYKQESDE